MSTVAAVPRNTGVLFVGRVAAQGLAVVMTVVLAARLGVTGLGEYALVSAVVFVANVATTFGTDMVLVREIAAGGRRHPVGRRPRGAARPVGTGHRR